MSIDILKEKDELIKSLSGIKQVIQNICLDQRPRCLQEIDLFLSKMTAIYDTLHELTDLVSDDVLRRMLKEVKIGNEHLIESTGSYYSVLNSVRVMQRNIALKFNHNRDLDAGADAENSRKDYYEKAVIAKVVKDEMRLDRYLQHLPSVHTIMITALFHHINDISKNFIICNLVANPSRGYLYPQTADYFSQISEKDINDRISSILSEDGKSMIFHSLNRTFKQQQEIFATCSNTILDIQVSLQNVDDQKTIDEITHLLMAFYPIVQVREQALEKIIDESSEQSRQAGYDSDYEDFGYQDKLTSVSKETAIIKGLDAEVKALKSKIEALVLREQHHNHHASTACQAMFTMHGSNREESLSVSRATQTDAAISSSAASAPEENDATAKPTLN